MPDLCNVDGLIAPEAEARIPVLDRGFLFGDSVYEVFRTRQGVPFAWREHLERLRESAESIAMPIDRVDAELMRPVLETVAASRRDEDTERYVRLIVTRGTGRAPSIDLGSATGPQRVVVLVRALAEAHVGRPVHAALVPRQAAPGREADPAVKSGNYVNNIVGLAEARRRGAEECIFVDPAGFVTEASVANLYAVFGDRVHTPPLGTGLLAGITRRLLIECAREIGLTMAEQPISAAELPQADEVFLSGTVRELGPVTHLDGQVVGDGLAGPITRGLQRSFDSYCQRRAQSDAAALRDLGLSP